LQNVLQRIRSVELGECGDDRTELVGRKVRDRGLDTRSRMDCDYITATYPESARKLANLAAR
jgi:hypothetical protein